MSDTFYAFKAYFNEFTKGIGSEINFDSDLIPFDVVASNRVNLKATFTLTQCIYLARNTPILSLRIKSHLNLKENYAKYVDLMQLVPLKFHDSEVLQQFLIEAGLVVGGALSDINDIEKIVDKYNVEEDYLQYLADLVGLGVLGGDEESLKSKRRQLIQAVDWYKRKGTYKSFRDISYSLGVTLDFWDMYTNDYSTFTRVPWFVGYEDENPSGLTADYYKSPHFGIDLVLNQKYGTGVTAYLFTELMYTNLLEQVEQIRPINVVNHYSLTLTANTTESGVVVTSAGDVKACVNGDWIFTGKNFNDSHKFNDGKFFDFREISFIETITKWEMGVGHVNTPPVTGDTSLESSVLSGSIDTQTIYDDRVEFDILIPLVTVQDGITEMGLFLDNGTTMVAQATFPSIEKINEVELRIKFIIYK